MATTQSTLSNLDTAHIHIENISWTLNSRIGLHCNKSTNALVIHKTYRANSTTHKTNVEAVLAQIRGSTSTTSGSTNSGTLHPHVQETHEITFTALSGKTASFSVQLLVPWYSGGDLEALYKRHSAAEPSRHINEDFLLRCFGQLASALDYLHTGQIVLPEKSPATIATATGDGDIARAKAGWTPILHSDIKPANIALSPSPVPGAYPNATLIDFDIACLASPQREPLEAFGCTSRYAAPEYPFASTASDIWALGATFHFLATGCTPRNLPAGHVKDSEEKLGVADYVVAVRLDLVRERYGRGLVGAVGACLAIEAEERVDARALGGMVEGAWAELGRCEEIREEDVGAGVYEGRVLAEWEMQARYREEGRNDSGVCW